jgi:hypothetical protein
MNTNAISFQQVYKKFDEFGLDLITTIDDFVKNIDIVDTFRFTYIGPCGHTRIGNMSDMQKICPHCVRNVKYMYNETGIRSIPRSKSIS